MRMSLTDRVSTGGGPPRQATMARSSKSRSSATAVDEVRTPAGKRHGLRVDSNSACASRARSRRSPRICGRTLFALEPTPRKLEALIHDGARYAIASYSHISRCARVRRDAFSNLARWSNMAKDHEISQSAEQRTKVIATAATVIGANVATTATYDQALTRYRRLARSSFRCGGLAENASRVQSMPRSGDVDGAQMLVENDKKSTRSRSRPAAGPSTDALRARSTTADCRRRDKISSVSTIGNYAKKIASGFLCSKMQERSNRFAAAGNGEHRDRMVHEVLTAS